MTWNIQTVKKKYWAYEILFYKKMIVNWELNYRNRNFLHKEIKIKIAVQSVIITLIEQKTLNSELQDFSSPKVFYLRK